MGPLYKPALIKRTKDRALCGKQSSEMAVPEANPEGAEHPDCSGADRAIRDHLPWLRSVVWSRLRDPEAVDDVVQEVLLAYAKHRPEELNGQLAPWLYRVAIRQCLLHRRRQGRWSRRQQEAQRRQIARWEQQHRQSPDPVRWLVEQERQELVRQAVEQLPDRDAQVVLLKYGQGWSYQQIAEHLGVSVSSVESRLHRARRRLRRLLAGAVNPSDE